MVVLDVWGFKPEWGLENGKMWGVTIPPESHPMSRGWKVIHYDWLARTKNSEEPERLDPFNFDLSSADKECWAREVVLWICLKSLNGVKKISGKIPNEESTKQHLILPILMVLDWDVFDPDEVMPETGTEEGQPDYAIMTE